MPKTILITGASTGFGRDTAETLARVGHHVFASMRDIAGRNNAHAVALRAAGISVVELDVTDDASVARAIAEVLAQAGHIDVLVNNAGIASAGVTEAFTADQAKILFNTNVVGVLRTMRAVLPGMRGARDGLIINIGSVLGRVTFPFFGIYGASKFALEAVTDSFRLELSQLGVDVVLVQPSAYPTNMYASIQHPADTALRCRLRQRRRNTRQDVRNIHGACSRQRARQTRTMLPQPSPSLWTPPKGQRPARTVVGQPFGADAVNDAVAPVQQRVVETLGLNTLATLAA